MGKLQKLLWPTTGEKQPVRGDIKKTIKQNWSKNSLTKGLKIYFIIYGAIVLLPAVMKFLNTSDDSSMLIGNYINLIMGVAFLILGFNIDKIKKDNIKFLFIFIVVVCIYEFFYSIQVNFLSTVVVLLKWGVVLFIINKAFGVFEPKK